MKIIFTIMITIALAYLGSKKETKVVNPHAELNQSIQELTVAYPNITVTIGGDINPQLLVYCDQPKKEVTLNSKFWLHEPFTAERKAILTQEIQYCWQLSQS